MVAQGNVLGDVISNHFPALKGHHKRGAFVLPLQGNVIVIIYPGRCPGLRLSLRFQRDKGSSRNTD